MGSVFRVFVFVISVGFSFDSIAQYDFWYDEGEVCLMQGDVECAIEKFEAASAANETDSVQFYLALSYHLQGTNNKARPILQSLITKDSLNLRAVLLLHELFDDEDLFKDASTVLSNYIERNPWNCEAYIARARLNLKYWGADNYITDDLESALFSCNDSSAVDALLILAEVYFELAEYEKASNAYNELFELAPEQARVLFDVATYKAEIGDYELAAGLFEKYRLKQPEDIFVFFQLGYCYLATGAYDKSAVSFTEYIRTDSSDAQAWYNRGIAYAADKKYDFAIRDLKIAYQKDPEMIESMYNLGLVYQNKGDYEKAIAAYNNYIRFVNNDPEAYYNLGLSKYYSDDKYGACADWDRMKNLGRKDLWKEIKTLCSDH